MNGCSRCNVKWTSSIYPQTAVVEQFLIAFKKQWSGRSCFGHAGFRSKSPGSSLTVEARMKLLQAQNLF